MRSRPSLILVALAIATCAAVPPASASSSAPPFAVAENCRDGVVLVPGVEERVRRRVPAQFELVRDPLGRPLLFVFASRCERYTAGGTTKPNTEGYVVAIIESPDGEGCSSRWPVVGAVKPDLVPFCNFYFLSGAFDNRAAVRTYRARFPGIALRYVPDLVYKARDFDLTRLGAPLRFRAGPPTPSPFELDAVVREQPVPGPATFSFWHTGSSGTVGARLEFDQLALGQMDATLRVARRSELAELLGTNTPTPLGSFVARYPHTEVRLLPPDTATAGDCKQHERSCDERGVNDNNDDRSNAGDPASTIQDTLDDILHGDGNNEDEVEDEEDGDDDDPNAGDPASTVQDTVDNILHGDDE